METRHSELAPEYGAKVVGEQVDQQVAQADDGGSGRSGDDARAKTAVIYLRVSSVGQVNTAVSREGYSIPAQREVCSRHAERLGASVVREYVEPGRSATSRDRPGLQHMLGELGELSPDYVIFYDLSRSARDEYDAFWLLREISACGAKLESTQERVDESAEGMLQYGIMSSVNAFRSRNDGKKVRLGLDKKHQEGGTIGPAPLGYLNVRETVADRQIAGIARDPERAPLVQLAFELCAEGDMTISEVTEVVAGAGLTTRATPARPSRPVGKSVIQRMLRNDYYVGVVTRNGVKQVGRHEALVSRDTFDKVQAVLDSRRAAGSKASKHPHHLGGMLVCGRCGRKLGFGKHRGKLGKVYHYFSCLSRVHAEGPCGLPYARVDMVEEKLEEQLGRVMLSAAEVERIEALVRERATERAEVASREGKRHERRLKELTTQQQKLVQLHYQDAISMEVLKAEQQRIETERSAAEKWKAAASAQVEDITGKLRQMLGLVRDPVRAYVLGDETARRLLLQSLFAAVVMEDDQPESDEPECVESAGAGVKHNSKNRTVSAELTEPHAKLQTVANKLRQAGALTGANAPAAALAGGNGATQNPDAEKRRGSQMLNMAERVGFEPTKAFTLCRFSRPVPSTTRSPLRAC